MNFRGYCRGDIRPGDTVRVWQRYRKTRRGFRHSGTCARAEARDGPGAHSPCENRIGVGVEKIFPFSLRLLMIEHPPLKSALKLTIFAPDSEEIKRKMRFAEFVPVVHTNVPRRARAEKEGCACGTSRKCGHSGGVFKN